MLAKFRAAGEISLLFRIYAVTKRSTRAIDPRTTKTTARQKGPGHRMIREQLLDLPERFINFSGNNNASLSNLADLAPFHPDHNKSYGPLLY